MAVIDRGFEGIQVLRSGAFTIVTGVNLIDTQGGSGDWNREEYSFLVPDERGNPLTITNPINGFAVTVFPATITSAGDNPVGWGVDTASITVERPFVRVHARIVVLGPLAHIFRIGFHVTLAQ
jgi:hypothetical protein